MQAARGLHCVLAKERLIDGERLEPKLLGFIIIAILLNQPRPQMQRIGGGSVGLAIFDTAQRDQLLSQRHRFRPARLVAQGDHLIPEVIEFVGLLQTCWGLVSKKNCPCSHLDTKPQCVPSQGGEGHTHSFGYSRRIGRGQSQFEIPSGD
jgi:hypothetical protein